MNKAVSFLKINLLLAIILMAFSYSFAQTRQSFEEIAIGSQVWMGENLNTEKFRNGDLIPRAKTKREWVEASKCQKPAWCYYANDSTRGAEYGRLYNWYAVSDPRGLAPEGWHIPSRQEWKQLTDHLGGEYEAAEKLKSKSLDWKDYNFGTNESGFTALPGGDRKEDGQFKFLGEKGVWWSCTTAHTEELILTQVLDYMGHTGASIGSKNSGFAVRCLKD